MDIATWLNALGLGQHERLFRDHAIDLEILPDLDEDDFEKLGIPLGHRKRLVKAIAALRVRSGEESPAAVGLTNSAPEAERRQVTVLFADLSGYTHLSASFDPEDLHTLMARVFDAIDAVVEGYGGSVDKHIGDCVMGVFGAPVAHGNDAERALRAAFDIHAAVGELDAGGRPLRVHLGVASGEVVASRTGGAGQRAHTVTGETVNLAARLTELAEPGATLASQAVHRALADRLEAVPLGDVAVRGLDRPVRVWRVHGLLPSAPAMQSSFVGRRTELGQFRGMVDACLDSGTGLAVHVRGEAGIGKTRLVEEFRRLAEERGFACHGGLVLDFGGGKGQDPIRAIVRGLLGAPDADDEEPCRAAVERAVAEGLVAPDGRVFLNDLLDLAQPLELRALYDAMDNIARNRAMGETVAALVRAASASAPRLLVVEDVHWADALTLAQLGTLAATVAECPAMLVVTSRPEGEPLDAAWRARTGNVPLVTLDLGPLRPTEALELAGAFAAADGRARACVERAQGNPLFLEQLLRHTEEEGTADGVPDTVRSLVLARMDRLEPLDRRALRAASVLGQRVSPDALRHLLADPAYDAGRLVRQHLLRPRAGDFLFGHALIREAVYGALLKTRRRELHGRAAAWYAGHDPVLRAEHLDRAEAPEAVLAYVEAAEAESSAFRFERALRLAERGAALARAVDERLRLGQARAELLRELGRPGEAIEAFRDLLALASADEVATCRAWIGVASCVRLLGDDEEGVRALEQAGALARRHGADRELAQIAYYRGCLLFVAGDVEACLEQYEQARDRAARAQDPEWEARALSGLGDAHYGRGRMRLAREQFRLCRELCRRHGFGRVEVGSVHMTGVTRRYLHEFREGLADLRAAADRAARIGNLRTEMVALTLLGEFLVDHGDVEAAYDALDRALGIVDGLGNRRYRGYILYELGRAFWHDPRRRDDAEPALAEALGLSRETGIGFVGPRVLAAKALTAASEPARREALAEGEMVVRAGCLAHNVLWFRRDAIEAALTVRDWQEAERHAAALEIYTRAEPLPWADFFVARGRALAARGRGEAGAELTAELIRLRDEAERVGLRSAWLRLEAALAGPPAFGDRG
ncbi:MAG: adenylate/guanylate cyclase domain-containing protein [Geminicoccaceae bacterium]